ncbi:MAG: sigma-70 family RNA polymerase sigma factor [Spirochaetales bacterium]|nr:sigma-70 family RNA polymerase sigma factor [Spirochaetales bacterium]
MEFSGDFIKRLRKKEKAAFEELYTRTWPALLNFIRFKVRNGHSTPEDILSEVYLRAIEYSHTLSSNVMGWLYRIARSKVVDHYRKKKRAQKLIRVETVAAGQREILNSIANAPEAETIESENALILRIGFSRLPGQYREALEAKYVREESVAAIAAAMGKTEKAVENILYRGRKLLEEQVAKTAKEKIYRYGKGGKEYGTSKPQ